MLAVCPSQSSFSVLFRVYRCCPIKVKLVWKTCVYFSYERIVFVRQLLFVWFNLSSVHTQRDRRANLWISKQWSQSFRYIIKRHFREIFCLCFCEFTLVQFFFFLNQRSPISFWSERDNRKHAAKNHNFGDHGRGARGGSGEDRFRQGPINGRYVSSTRLQTGPVHSWGTSQTLG